MGGVLSTDEQTTASAMSEFLNRPRLVPIVGRERSDGNLIADETCAICLDAAATHHFGRACQHCFCESCLQHCALNGYDRCPICRSTRHCAPRPVCSVCKSGAVLVNGRCPVCRQATRAVSESGDRRASAVSAVVNIDVPSHQSAAPPSHQLPLQNQLEAIAPALARHGLSPAGASCAFDSSKDGVSLQLLRRRLLDVDAAMLSVTTTSGETLGVFTGFNWQPPSLRSYGTNASFLFHLPAGRTPQIWHATQKNMYIMYSKPDFVAFGLSEAGYGLQLDADLATVTSARTETFDNQPLGEMSVSRVVALSWRVGASFELEFGSTGEEARSIGRALLAFGGRQTIEADYFG